MNDKPTTWLDTVSLKVRSDKEVLDDNESMTYEIVIPSDYSILKSKEITNLSDLLIIKHKSFILVTDDHADTAALAHAMKQNEGYKAYRISDNVDNEQHHLLALSILLNKYESKVLLKTSRSKDVEAAVLLIKGHSEFIIKGNIEASATQTYVSKEHEMRSQRAQGFLTSMIKNSKAEEKNIESRSLEKGGEIDDRKSRSQTYTEDFRRTRERNGKQFSAVPSIEEGSSSDSYEGDQD